MIVQDGVNFIYYLNGALDTTVTGAILYTNNIIDAGADGGSWPFKKLNRTEDWVCFVNLRVV